MTGKLVCFCDMFGLPRFFFFGGGRVSELNQKFDARLLFHFRDTT